MTQPDYFLTIQSKVKVEQKITGSTFICDIIPVKTKDEAMIELNLIREKYYDATHHCSAWKIFNYQTFLSESKSSDDGEPSGTAGKPILAVLEGENLTNLLVVVTRYFGGTKLGTGGLVRAYGSSAKLGIENSQIVKEFLYIFFEIQIHYDFISALNQIINHHQIQVVKSEYGETVYFKLGILPSEVESADKIVYEKSNGKFQLKPINQVFN